MTLHSRIYIPWTRGPGIIGLGQTVARTTGLGEDCVSSERNDNECNQSGIKSSHDAGKPG